MSSRDMLRFQLCVMTIHYKEMIRMTNRSDVFGDRVLGVPNVAWHGRRHLTFQTVESKKGFHLPSPDGPDFQRKVS